MKKKLKNKKWLFYGLVFIIPALIVLAHIFSMEIIKGNYIKNGENFLMADMSSQYNSIYAYIWDVLRGNDSIFYSFGKSLGGNMASTVGYYAASPLNFMYLFCKKIDVPVMTFILYLIKIGLSSLFMYIFLNHKVKKDKAHLIFSIMYALMAYNVNYYFNNMWLDVIALAPLVALGIDKLIEKKSILLYTVTLALAIVSNFYIAYMLCIFCVLYFLYQLFVKYKIKQFKEYKMVVLRFTLGSLLAAGLSMICLLPEVLNLREIMRFSVDKNNLNIDLRLWPKQFLKSVLCKLYMGSHNTTSVLSRVRPNLYSGMLTIVLLYFYFLNKKFKVREKVLSGLVIFFYLLSFMLPHLNLFWQAGSFPNGYICRYSFTFSLFIIYLAAKTFVNLNKVKIRYFIIFALVYGLLSIKISVQYLEFMEISDVVISSIFVLIYLIIIFLMMYLKKSLKKILTIITAIVVIIELFLNFKMCFIVNSEINMIGSYGDFYTEACDRIKSYETDTGFYRIDGDYRYSHLDSWICNSHSITSSLSTNTGDLYRFWKKNGGSVTYTTIVYDQNKLPIFDAIFGIKYIKSYSKFTDTYYDLYDKIPANSTKKMKKTKKGEKKQDKKQYRYVYKNPYALSLGYAIPNNYREIYDSYKVKDTVESMNRLMKTLSGNEEDVLVKYPKKYSGKGKYRFNINNDVDYIYLSFAYDTSVNWTVYDSIYINGEYVLTSQSEDIGNMKLKNKYANSLIKLQVGDKTYPSEHDNLEIYYIDMDVFEKDIELMKQNQLMNIVIDGNKVTGDIDVDKDSVLFTSIPYEKGWRVYVDGKRVKYEKVVDEFVGIRLKKGTHKIKMVYYPHHLDMGAIITVISIGILVYYEVSIRKKKKATK